MVGDYLYKCGQELVDEEVFAQFYRSPRNLIAKIPSFQARTIVTRKFAYI
jgi:hypothetical protein